MIATMMLLAGTAVAAPKYPGFEVTLRGDSKTSFRFSDADATSELPVVISIPGRALAEADREHRISLQKHWLSVNVPKNLVLEMRAQVQCAFKRDGEFSVCDCYTYSDPATGKQVSYYIYIGNWP